MSKKGTFQLAIGILAMLLVLSTVPTVEGATFEPVRCDTPPTIDGSIDSGEWSGAAGYNRIFYNIYINASITVALYFMNDDDNLYIQLVWQDISGDEVDTLEILFDEENDNNWTGPGIENGVAITMNSTHFEWYDGYCVQSAVHVLPDVVSTDGAAAVTKPGLQYIVELAIPLGMADQEDLQPDTGALIGIAIIIGDDINLPSSVLYELPAGALTFGYTTTLQLASKGIGTPLTFALLLPALLIIAVFRTIRSKKRLIPS